MRVGFAGAGDDIHAEPTCDADDRFVSREEVHEEPPHAAIACVRHGAFEQRAANAAATMLRQDRESRARRRCLRRRRAPRQQREPIVVTPKTASRAKSIRVDVAGDDARRYRVAKSQTPILRGQTARKWATSAARPSAFRRRAATVIIETPARLQRNRRRAWRFVPRPDGLAAARDAGSRGATPATSTPVPRRRGGYRAWRQLAAARTPPKKTSASADSHPASPLKQRDQPGGHRGRTDEPYAQPQAARDHARSAS